ncbi:MAG: hypothetical protein WC785_05720 [Tatlockia sp.]|jgi:hypothetical protein
MKKLNRNYLSFYEAIGLSDKHLYRYHDGATKYPIQLSDSVKFVPDNLYPHYQFLGALYPIVKLFKSFSDLVRPYQSAGKRKRDVAQPIDAIFTFFHGLGSLAGGAIILSLWLLLSPLLLIACFIPDVEALFAKPLLAKVIYPLSWCVEGLASMTNGLLRFSTTPWLLVKIPVRAMISWFVDKTPAEEKPEIRRLAADAMGLLRANRFSVITPEIEPPKSYENTLRLMKLNQQANKERKKIADLFIEVNRKYTKSVQDGWKTHYTAAELQATFSSLFTPFTKCINAEKQYDGIVPLAPIDDALIANMNNFMEQFNPGMR